jgi:4-hydroxy-2-oxoheptanedioate aldolase
VQENIVKRRLRAGETTIGSWLTIPDALSTESMALIGWDWLLIDMEHSPAALHEAAAMLTACRTTDVTAIIRPAWNESSHVQRALDLGARGIVVPVVNDAADARRLVTDARFPPLGERSRGGVRANQAWHTDAATYFARANEEVLVLPQCETETAVKNIDEILAVEGIDGVFVGPNDLAASTGKPWPGAWLKDDDYMALIKRVTAATKKANKVAGILARDAQMAKEMADLGYRFIGVGGDVNFMTAGAKKALDEARAAIGR